MIAATPQPQHLPFALVVNPSSALGRGAQVAAKVSRALQAANVSSVTILAASAEECQRLVDRAATDGVRGLILVGGDGLVSTVIQLASARTLPIGLVPAGSGNDFARQFSLPREPESAVAALLAAERQPTAVDLGVVRYPAGSEAGAASLERWFAGGLSIGFDAAINRRANALKLRIGPFRYLLALLAEIATLRLPSFHVSHATPARNDAPDHHYAGILATVMNIRTLGGGIPISPKSSVSDGRLDLIEVTQATKIRLLSVLGTLARGKHERLPEVRMTPITSVRIEAGDEVAFADGEEVGTGPFEVRVVPGALTVLAR